MSRTPVREALRQLELEGLVKIVPNKGAYVTGITGKDVKRMIIWCTPSWKDFAPDGRPVCLYRTDRKTRRDCFLSEFHANKNLKEKSGQVVELDGKFHEVLYEASNSRTRTCIIRFS